MENVIVNVRKDGQNNEKSLHCLSKGMISAEDNNGSHRLIRTVNPEHVFQLNSRIPKQIISFDEQYLRYCLEFIKLNALKAASCNVPLDVSTISDHLRVRRISSGNLSHWNENISESLFVPQADNFTVSSAGYSILGAITESKSMINILKSPLLCQLGASDSSVNLEGTSSEDVGQSLHYNIVNSPAGSHTNSSKRVQKEALILKDHINGSDSADDRLSSLSSTPSSCSLQSSSAPMSQGMLHCSWNNGLPRYVFSIDDRGDTFIANMLKAESPDNKVLDYMYMFHLGAGGRKEDKIHDKESDLVGKMRVTTSFTLQSDKTKIKETQFVLFGVSDDCPVEMQTPSHTLKRNFFSTKVANVLKASHTYKMRNSSKSGVFSALQEKSSSNPDQDSSSNLRRMSRVILSEDHFPPNLELAAIVVKDHIRRNDNKTDLGGWGMKFLKKYGSGQTNAPIEKEVSSSNNIRDSGDCSTSMNILIPAGLHGGPRTRDGGPSRLTERWKSGEQCDCGGWDTGCPLTVFNARSNRTDVFSQTDVHWGSKAFDIFVEGSKQDVPTLKMVNIHDDLYYISFQSKLSPIQSFSIAIAIIHTHSPVIQSSPKK